MAGDSISGKGSRPGSPAGRLAREVSSLQATLLGKLGAELGESPASFAAAAQRLAEDFGSVTATAVDAALEADPAASARATAGFETAGRATAGPATSGFATAGPATGDLSAGGAGAGAGVASAPAPAGSAPAASASAPTSAGSAPAASASAPRSPAAGEHCDLASLYRPGHMRRRLDQMAETHRRYGHPFALALFDASGPGTRQGDPGGGQETALAVVGAALRDSIRIVDEAFRLEEDAICVLAPNLGTVEAVQMAERLMGQLDDLERAGGLRIAVSAGVVACPDHGGDVEGLLQKADTAMWRARAVGQPLGVGALQDR